MRNFLRLGIVLLSIVFVVSSGVAFAENGNVNATKPMTTKIATTNTIDLKGIVEQLQSVTLQLQNVTEQLQNSTKLQNAATRLQNMTKLQNATTQLQNATKQVQNATNPFDNAKGVRSRTR